MDAPEEKSSFILYYTYYQDAFSKLDEHQRSLLIDAIFSTGGVCEMPELDEKTDLVWGFIATHLGINDNRWQETKQRRSEGGKKSAKVRAEQREQERQEIIERAQAEENEQDPAHLTHSTHLTHLTHSTVNVNDNANGNDNVNGNVNDIDNVNVNGNGNSNAQSADGLTPVCSADAEPEREKSSAKKQSVSKKIEEHFRELWMLYPLKRGKNHVKAAAKRRLADVSAAEMARAIDRYEREYENAPPDRQMLYGSTWFNGRWEDYSDDNYTPAPAKPAQKSARAQQAQFRSAEEESKQADYWAGREE